MNKLKRAFSMKHVLARRGSILGSASDLYNNGSRAQSPLGSGMGRRAVSTPDSLGYDSQACIGMCVCACVCVCVVCVCVYRRIWVYVCLLLYVCVWCA